MNKIYELDTFTKSTLGIGLTFLIYGSVCRMIPINFFWESKSIGWGLVFLGMIGLLLNGVKKRKAKNKNAILNKIGIGVICFILLVQTILIIAIPNSDAYTAAKEFVMNNEELISEIGSLEGFGLLPTGAIAVQKNSNGESGNANINMIIKGSRSYKSVTIFVSKEYGEAWEVYRVD